MRKDDEDGLPVVESSASALGVRPGTDIDVVDGHVPVNGKGMSVSPSWRDISFLRIPKRLRDKVPSARGSNSAHCYKFGSGPFQAGPFAEGLALHPDSRTHGCVTPAEPMTLEAYAGSLTATRDRWEIDEN